MFSPNKTEQWCLMLLLGFDTVVGGKKMFEQNVFAVSAGWAAVVWRGHRGAVDWLVWGWNVTVHAEFVLNWIWKDVTCVAAWFFFYMLVIDTHSAVDIYFVLTNAADNSSDLLCFSSTHRCPHLLMNSSVAAWYSPSVCLAFTVAAAWKYILLFVALMAFCVW